MGTTTESSGTIPSGAASLDPRELSRHVAALGRDDEIQSILTELCELTGMGFAAIAYVSDKRWIACQVDDRIEFGMSAGDELEIKKTICDEIRQSGEAVLIDDTANNPDWWSHPVPILYGFHSYLSLPLHVEGEFFGTMCALDPAPCKRRLADARDQLDRLAARAAARLQARLDQTAPAMPPSLA